MPLYLADTIGLGTREDPWRPRGSDQAGYSSIKLGPGSADARWLVWLPIAESHVNLRALGDDRTETPAAATVTTISSQLNVDVTGAPRIDTLVLWILERPPSSGLRWNRLAPTLVLQPSGVFAARWQVWLNGEAWTDAPVIAGGVSHQSTFDGSENPLSESGTWNSGNSGVWSDMQKVSGVAQGTALSAGNGARLTTPALRPDQYAQATLTFSGAGQTSLWCRAQAGTSQQYTIAMRTADTPIQEVDAAYGATTLATGAASASGSVMRLEVSGSTLYGYDDGVLIAGPVTDTTITNGQPGIGTYAEGALGNSTIDNFDGGDMTVGTSFVSRVRLRPGMFAPGIAR